MGTVEQEQLKACKFVNKSPATKLFASETFSFVRDPRSVLRRNASRAHFSQAASRGSIGVDSRGESKPLDSPDYRPQHRNLFRFALLRRRGPFNPFLSPCLTVTARHSTSSVNLFALCVAIESCSSEHLASRATVFPPAKTHCR